MHTNNKVQPSYCWWITSICSQYFGLSHFQMLFYHVFYSILPSLVQCQHGDWPLRPHACSERAKVLDPALLLAVFSGGNRGMAKEDTVEIPAHLHQQPAFPLTSPASTIIYASQNTFKLLSYKSKMIDWHLSIVFTNLIFSVSPTLFQVFLNVNHSSLLNTCVTRSHTMPFLSVNQQHGTGTKT